MKDVRWSLIKNDRLKRVRGVSFEELIQAELIAVKRHPKMENQSIMLFEYGRQIWVVPFVETEKELFLKTLYASRKYTKLYKKGELK